MSDLNQTQSDVEPAVKGRTHLARYNIILAVLLVVQVGLTAFVFWPQPSNAASGETLLGDLTIEDVNAMTITDNNDRSIRVERGNDGWVLAGTDGYPAKTEEITSTLTSLLAMTKDRLVTQTAGSHSRLQVAENNFLRRIDLETAEGEQTLYLGSTAGASATHVRLAGEDATYLTNEVSSWELDTLASSWIDITYFSVDAESITGIALANANGTFDFVKEDGAWTFADAQSDETVATANIEALANRIASINITRPLGQSIDPSYGMDSPSATVTVQVDGESGPATYTLTQGPLLEDDNLYPFKASDSPYYVLIAKFVGDDFSQKERSDFLVAPDAEAGDDTSAAPQSAAPVGTAENVQPASEDATNDAANAPASPLATPEPVE